MTVKKCDRCKEIYKQDDFYISQVIYYFNESIPEKGAFNGTSYDLCPECTKKIIDFITGVANISPIDSHSSFIY